MTTLLRTFSALVVVIMGPGAFGGGAVRGGCGWITVHDAVVRLYSNYRAKRMLMYPAAEVCRESLDIRLDFWQRGTEESHG